MSAAARGKCSGAQPARNRCARWRGRGRRSRPSMFAIGKRCHSGGARLMYNDIGSRKHRRSGDRGDRRAPRAFFLSFPRRRKSGRSALPFFVIPRILKPAPSCHFRAQAPAEIRDPFELAPKCHSRGSGNPGDPVAFLCHSRNTVSTSIFTLAERCHSDGFLQASARQNDEESLHGFDNRNVEFHSG